MIGKTLDGRYRIIQELGRGGFGETFVAIDIKLHNSRCVVKKLNPFSEYRGTLKARILFELVKKLNPFSEYRKTLKLARRLFEQESKIMLRLEHNQIPRLLAYFEQNKNFFLAQELVQGHPLNEEIRVGEQWTVDTMVHFLASALKPLAYIHTQHVIHRDIKPANLMRRDIDGEIVLIDFGAVKEVIKSSRHGQVQAVNTIAIGTTGYTPNEQSERQPRYSSDIYALGITCIEALTGRAATELEKDPHSEISWRHLVNIDIDPRLADIIDRMVRYDFRQRYSSGGEALASVQAYIKSLPSPLSSPTLSYVPQHKLVNTYSDELETKPTKKISIATKVSSVLHLKIANIYNPILWISNLYDKVSCIIRESKFRLPQRKNHLQKIKFSNEIRLIDVFLIFSSNQIIVLTYFLFWLFISFITLRIAESNRELAEVVGVFLTILITTSHFIWSDEIIKRVRIKLQITKKYYYLASFFAHPFLVINAGWQLVSCMQDFSKSPLVLFRMEDGKWFFILYGSAIVALLKLALISSDTNHRKHELFKVQSNIGGHLLVAVASMLVCFLANIISWKIVNCTVDRIIIESIMNKQYPANETNIIDISWIKLYGGLVLSQFAIYSIVMSSVTKNFMEISSSQKES